MQKAIALFHLDFRTAKLFLFGAAISTLKLFSSTDLIVLGPNIASLVSPCSKFGIFSNNLFTTVVFPVPDGAEITINFPVLSFMKRLKCKISQIT